MLRLFVVGGFVAAGTAFLAQQYRKKQGSPESWSKYSGPLAGWPGLAGRLVDVPDVGAIYTVELGTGDGKPIVLVHGLGDDADGWAEVALGLAATGWHVFILDLPGFGRSSPIPNPTPPNLVEAIHSWVVTLGVPTPCVFVGHSMGAALVQLLSLQQPQLLARQYLLSGSLVLPPRDEPRRRPPLSLILFLIPFLGEYYYRRQRNEPSQSVDKALQQYYGDPAHLSYARQAQLMQRIPQRLFSERLMRGFLLTYRSVVRFFVRSVPALQVPLGASGAATVVVWGGRDQVTDPRVLEQVRRLLPAATVHLLPEYGHNLQSEAPEEVLRIINTP